MEEPRQRWNDETRRNAFKKIEGVVASNNMLDIRMDNIESAYDRHTKEHEAIREDIRTMGAEIRKLIEMVASMREVQKNHSEELKSLWAWPVKILTVISAIGVVVTYFWKLINWVIVSSYAKVYQK